MKQQLRHLTLIMFTLVVLMFSTGTVTAQDKTIEGDVFYGSIPLEGIKVTVMRGRRYLNSTMTTTDGKYSISFPAGERVTIKYEPTGTGNYPEQFEGVSGQRDHRISVVLKSTSVALTVTEASRFYGFASDTIALDRENNIPAKETRIRYAPLMDKVRVALSPTDAQLDFVVLQANQSVARKLYGLAPDMLRDVANRPLAPPGTSPMSLRPEEEKAPG